jgi:hypothetical protein
MSQGGIRERGGTRGTPSGWEKARIGLLGASLLALLAEALIGRRAAR